MTITVVFGNCPGFTHQPSAIIQRPVTEFDWSVFATLERRPDLQRLFVERRYFRRDKQLRFQRQGRTQRVVPDSGFLLRVGPRTSGRPADDGVLPLHLTELDNGTMSAARVREKLVRYSRWAESEAGQQYLTGFYRGYRGRPASMGQMRQKLLRLARLIPEYNVVQLKNMEVTANGRRIVPLGIQTNTVDLPRFMERVANLRLAIELKPVSDNGGS